MKKHSLALAPLVFAISLHAQQTVNYINGENKTTAISTTAPNSPTTLNLASGSAIQSGVISGTGQIVKQGLGTLILSGINTYTGATTVVGTLQIGNGVSGSINSSGSISLGTGGTIAFNTSNSHSNNILTSASTNVFGAQNAGVTTPLSGIISGGGGFTQTGPGRTLLSGNNTYTGATTVNAGTLLLAANERIANTSALTINGGTFDLGTFNETLGAVTLTSGSISGGVTSTLTGSSYALQSGTVSAKLGGSASLTKSTPGTVTLSGSNTYTGATIVSDGTLSLGGLDVIADSSALTVNGGTFQLYLSAETVGAVTLTSGSISGNATGVLIGSSYALQSGAVSAVLGGTANLTKSTSGTVILSGNNTYAGSTAVNAGTLQVGDGVSGSIDANSAISVASGARLALNISGTFLNNAGIANSGTIEGMQGSGITTILDGAIGGSGGFTQTGAGTTLLSRQNTYTGTTLVNAGTLKFGADNQIFKSSALIINGGTFDLGAFDEGVGFVTLSSGSIIGSGTLTGPSYSLQAGTVSAKLGGSASLTKSTSGTVILSGNNTYTGATTVSAGTLQIGDGVSGSINSNSSVSIAPGAKLALNISGAFLNNSGIVNSGTIEGGQGSGITTTLDSVIGGTGGFTQTGAGTTILSRQNTYTGATLVNAGILQIGNAGLGSISADSAVAVASGATLAFNTFNSGNFLFNNIDNEGTVAGAQDLGVTTILGGIISGAGGFTQSGAGTTVFTNENTYTGATLVNAGTLRIGNGLVGSISSSSVSVAPGATLAFNTVGTVSSNIANSGTVLSAQSAGVTTLSGIISGTNGFTQSGAGKTILSGLNTYAGPTAVDAGILQIGDGISGSISSGFVSVAPGATLAFNTGSSIPGNIANSGTVKGVQDFGITTTLGGVISGTSGFSQTGEGTTIFSGNNTYTGDTVVDVGTLQIGKGGSGSISTSSIVSVASGATLAFDISGPFLNDIANSGTVAGAQSAGVTTPLGSIISGTGGFSQTGTGTTILSGNNTYTGPTLVDAGTLQIGNGVSGSISSSPVSVASGARLALNLSGTFSNSIANSGTVASIQPTGITTIFDGVISGTGGFSQTGAGTTILSRYNVYTGPTIVDAGTLQIGNGGLGSINNGGSISVASGATLAFDSEASLFNDIVNGGIVVAVQSADIITKLGGVISGTGGFTQSGAGTTILSGDNTYTGPTTVNAGTLQIGNAGSGSIDASSPVSIALGATLAFNLNGTILNDIANNGALTSSQTAGNTATFGGIISGTGGFSQTGAGTTILSGNNTYTGDTVVNAGTLKLGTSERIADSSALTINGGTFDLGAFDETVGAVTLTSGSISGATGTLTGSSYALRAGTVSAILGGSASLTKSTSGTVILSGSNTYTGPTLVDAGTLQIGDGISGLIGSGSVSVAPGAVLAFNMGSSIPGNITNNGSVLGAQSAGVTTILSGVISGEGGFSQTGPGTTILSGSNTYTGLTTVGAGTLQIGNGVSGSINGSPVSVGIGATLAFNISGTFSNDIASSGTVTGAQSAGVTTNLTGVISGLRGFTQSGAGTTIFGGSNTYTGNTTVNAGTLSLGASERIANIGALLINGGTFDLGTFNETVDGVALFSGSISGSGTLTSASYALEAGTVSAILGGTGTLTKSSSGTVILSGDNTYTGGTTIKSGTLSLGASERIANTGVLALAGGTLDLGAFNETLGAVTLSSGSIVGSGTLTGSSYTLLNGTVSAILGGSANLSKFGNGTVILSGDNTYTGTTTVSAGTLSLGASERIANTGVLTINGGTFDLGTYNETLGSLTLNGGSISGSGTLTGSSYTLQAGAISAILGGSANLSKFGNDTVILSGDNTYTGPTTIFGGTLLVNGSLADSSIVTIRDGGTLGGHGTLGAVKVASGGTISPGTSIGAAGYIPSILTTGNETWNAGGRYIWYLADATSVAGSGWDMLSINGAFAISSTPSARFTINVASLSGNEPGDTANFDETLSQSWIIAAATTSWTFDPNQFAINTSAFTNSSLPGSTWSLSQVGNGLQLNYSAVPEPTTYGLLAVGLLAGLILRIRRCKHM